MPNKDRLVQHLRKSLGIYIGVTDDEVLNKTMGTFLRASIELSLAVEDFKRAVVKMWAEK